MKRFFCLIETLQNICVNFTKQQIGYAILIIGFEMSGYLWEKSGQN